MQRLKKIVQKNIFIEVFILFVLSLTPLLWLGHGWVILGHDSGFRPAIDLHYNALLTGWYSVVNTGIDWSLYKGFLIIQLPELVLQSVLGSLETAQLIILPFWFFVMAMGMYITIRGFFPEKKYWFLRLYTSIFWIFNFYILQAWGIAERAKFSLYAALPISIFLISKTFERKISLLVGAALFGFLYLFCNGGGSPPLFGASVVVWILTTMYWSLIGFRKKGIKELFFGISVLLLFLGSFIVMSAYWVLVDFDLYRGTYQNVVSQSGGLEGLFAWERAISKSASLINLLRLQGIPDWIENSAHQFSHQFLTNPILIILSFFPLSSILLGIVLFRKKLVTYKERSFLGLLVILGLTGLFFSAGSHPPTGDIYVFLMRHVPGFVIFRSSFYKFAPVLWFSIIVASGFFIKEILMHFSQKKQVIISVIILIGIIVYHYPYFNPTFFQFAPQFTTRVQIPDYVKKTATFLDQTDTKSGRVLLLPELDRGFINLPLDTYTWGFYSLDILPRLVAHRSVIANDANNEVISSIYDRFYGADWNAFKSLASYLNISQILYRGDEQRSMAIPARNVDVDTLHKQFGNPVYKSGPWEVYNVNNSRPEISVQSNLYSLVEPFVHNSLPMAEATNAAFLNLSWSDIKTIPDVRFAVETECLYCAKDEYTQYEQSIVLPDVKFLPGSFLYPLLGARKLPKVTSSMSPPQTIDVELARTMIRLSEYVRLKQKGEEKTAEEINQDYIHSIDHIINTFGTFNGREQIIYANRLLLYGLKQQDFFASVQSQSPEQLNTLIAHVRPYSWITDDKFYRLVVVIPEKGTFEGDTVSSYSIDGDIPKDTKNLNLSDGIHKIEISKNKDNELKPPVVIFQSNTMTETVSTGPSWNIVSEDETHHVIDIENFAHPYVLIFPQTYDARWLGSIVKGNVNYIKHVQVDGYANGWLISANGPIEMKISYALENRFRFGLIVTGIGILFGLVIIGVSSRRKMIHRNV